MSKRSALISLLAIIVVIGLSSCAPHGDTVKEYSFFSGILHGFIFIFAVIGKLFGGSHGLYAENNTGFFYWLGFLFGLGIIGEGGAASRRK